jgi:hypothetical protein
VNEGWCVVAGLGGWSSTLWYTHWWSGSSRLRGVAVVDINGGSDGADTGAREDGAGASTSGRERVASGPAQGHERAAPGPA